MYLPENLYRLTDRDEQTLLIQPEAASLTASLTGGSNFVVAAFPASFPGLDRAFLIQRTSWRLTFPAGNNTVVLAGVSLFVVDQSGVVRDIVEQRGNLAVPVFVPELGTNIIGGAAAQQYTWTSSVTEEFLVRPGGRLGISLTTNINPITPTISLDLACTGIAFPPGGIGR